MYLTSVTDRSKVTVTRACRAAEAGLGLKFGRGSWTDIETTTGFLLDGFEILLSPIIVITVQRRVARETFFHWIVRNQTGKRGRWRG